MAGLELLSDQGYRVDGRRAGELRKIQARMGVFAQADGSAYIEQGNTKALAVVYGPHEASGRARAGRGARGLQAELKMPRRQPSRAASTQPIFRAAAARSAPEPKSWQRGAPWSPPFSPASLPSALPSSLLFLKAPPALLVRVLSLLSTLTSSPG